MRYTGCRVNSLLMSEASSSPCTLGTHGGGSLLARRALKLPMAIPPSASPLARVPCQSLQARLTKAIGRRTSGSLLFLFLRARAFLFLQCDNCNL